MRVIAGEFRSRRLKSLEGSGTRPTPDRLRESLFSILQLRIVGAVFIDAYAGTGAVGIEALSRGASRVEFLERNPAAIRVIEDNLYALGIGNRGHVQKGRVTRLLQSQAAPQATIAFLDPPYDEEDEYTEALEWLGKHPPGLVIAQHHRKLELREEYGFLVRRRIVSQGDNRLSFFEPRNPMGETPQFGSDTPESTPQSGS